MIDGLVQFRDSNYYTDKQGNVYRHYPEKIKVYFTTQGYEFRKKFPERLKPVKPFNGGRFGQYRQFTLGDIENGLANIRISVHRFVYEAFNGPIPDGMEIHHIDGNGSNNKINNLELVTRQQNIAYRG